MTGAFGYTGRWIAHQLLDEGKRVRTLTNAVGRDDPFDGRVEGHPLDFQDRKALVESLRGADVLYTPTGCDTTTTASSSTTKLPLRTAD